ncbi:hypothetical protein AVEN_54668-1 [Araneus ventricosus]|uniref:Uncharacterized protein n=1 Tax=Araneus ventricosus TaxID=182803 RepID=A0A4Y2BLB1_ARAVE|nr:hypothetical protein AVEN_54668-1 [Araneus ventricosus]
MSLSHVPSIARFARVTSVGRALLLHTNKPNAVHCYAEPVTCRTETALLSLCGNLQLFWSLVRKIDGKTVGQRNYAALSKGQYALSIIIEFRVSGAMKAVPFLRCILAHACTLFSEIA